MQKQPERIRTLARSAVNNVSLPSWMTTAQIYAACEYLFTNFEGYLGSVEFLHDRPVTEEDASVLSVECTRLAGRAFLKVYMNGDEIDCFAVCTDGAMINNVCSECGQEVRRVRAQRRGPACGLSSRPERDNDSPNPPVT